MKSRVVPKAGFTLVEIMIVVAIIGLLAAIAIPNFIHARTISQTNACINNLRQIDGSKQEWALEMKKQPTAIPGPTEIQPYLGRGSRGSLPVCPLDATSTFATSYNPQAVSTPPTCLISTSNHVLN